MLVTFLTSLSILAMFEFETSCGRVQNILPPWISEYPKESRKQIDQVWFSDDFVESAGVQNYRMNQDIGDQVWFSNSIPEGIIPEGTVPEEKQYNPRPKQNQHVVMKVLKPGVQQTADINTLRFKFRL